MASAVFYRNSVFDNIDSKPPSAVTAFTRFIAGLIMQIKMSKEFMEGMSKMKYALNHSWKFTSPTYAYFTGFLQASMVAIVVILNYYSILLEENPIGIVMNFLALMVIAELDDYFYEAHGYILPKRMIMEQDSTYAQMYKI